MNELFYECDLCGWEGCNNKKKCTGCGSPFDMKKVIEYNRKLHIYNKMFL